MRERFLRLRNQRLLLGVLAIPVVVHPVGPIPPGIFGSVPGTPAMVRASRWAPAGGAYRQGCRGAEVGSGTLLVVTSGAGEGFPGRKYPGDLVGWVEINHA